MNLLGGGVTIDVNRLRGCLIWFFFSKDVKAAPAEDAERYKNMLLRDVDNLDKAISALLGKAGPTFLTGGSSVFLGRGAEDFPV